MLSPGALDYQVEPHLAGMAPGNGAAQVESNQAPEEGESHASTRQHRAGEEITDIRRLSSVEKNYRTHPPPEGSDVKLAGPECRRTACGVLESPYRIQPPQAK